MKKIIITLLILISFTGISQTGQVPKQEKKITLTLTVQEVDVVLNALQTLPYKDAAGVINSIYSQASRQLADTSKQKK